MSAEKKQAKKQQQKLELRIKKVLGKFTTGVKSKKLEKKIKKYSSNLAGVILKVKEPAKSVKVKNAKAKNAPVKQVKKSMPANEK